MRFRRISFPLSALLSILAISLYFFHGLNFGIDFKGGTLMEVRDHRRCRRYRENARDHRGLGLGEAQLQQFGGPNEVLIRIAEQPGGDAAQQVAVTKVKAALGNDSRLPPRRGGRTARVRRAPVQRRDRPRCSRSWAS